MKNSRSFVWLVVFGVVALFAFATPDITDSAFNETETPMTVSLAALPQARLGLPAPAARVSGEIRNPLVVQNSLRIYHSEQNRHLPPQADLRKLLCVFLI